MGLISTHPTHTPSSVVISTHTTHMPSPWLISTHTMHTPSPWMISSHPTHSCLHCWAAHTNVSIAGQHPPSKHPCLHLWPASTHQGHCCASPGRGLSTSSTPKLVTLQR